MGENQKMTVCGTLLTLPCLVQSTASRAALQKRGCLGRVVSTNKGDVHSLGIDMTSDKKKYQVNAGLTSVGLNSIC